VDKVHNLSSVNSSHSTRDLNVNKIENSYYSALQVSNTTKNYVYKCSVHGLRSNDD